MLLFKGLCRLFIKAMHMHALRHMHVQHVHADVQAHMHVFIVNMPERIFAYSSVCVGLIHDDDATCQDAYVPHQQLLL